jgi:hypothetical protein
VKSHPAQYRRPSRGVNRSTATRRPDGLRLDSRFQVWLYKTLIDRILGTLPADDIERVAEALRQAFAL